jgi:hypothetical protein
VGYTALETLVAPDVPDEVNEVFHPIRPSRHSGLKVLFLVFVLTAAVMAAPEEVAGAFLLRGTWRAIDIAALGLEVAMVATLVRRMRSRRRRIDRLWGSKIIKAAAQATDNPDTAARLAGLDQLIVRLRSGYLALADAGYEPAGITARTADDLHYTLAAPVIKTFALRDLLRSPAASRPELETETAAAQAELAAMNAAFDTACAALAKLCDQVDSIRQQLDIAAARQQLRAALAAADLPAAPAGETPDIETMSATATAMVEFLRSSLA